MRKKQKNLVLENITVTDYAAEGKALARIDGKVIFISGAIPGDTVDVRLGKNKKDWAEGHTIALVQPSKDRLQPFCDHFGTCGGCKWQMLPYAKQLQYKQQEAEQNLKRIGKTDIPELMPILGAAETVHYRNKVEFTFSNKKYIPPSELHSASVQVFQNALGYHAPRIFDKAIDIHTCHLMHPINDRIRNTVRELALANNWTFYDAREHTGWLRNMVLRFTRTGELMLNVVLHHEEENDRKLLLDHLLTSIPEITTLLYTINPKWNDSLYDLSPQVYFGNGYVTEKLNNLSFIISPLSFFQTNTAQAEKLYEVAKSFAGLTGNEIVYDLYCGTGSIGIFVSDMAKKVVGVEVVESAIEDAKKNASLNGISHCSFFAGDVIKICNNEFFATHGRPDVVITDPPRAGMHEKLIQKLLEMEAPKIVYVSCNTATQARDIALLAEKYKVVKVQPVDMFPHTHHIECVALLTLITNA